MTVACQRKIQTGACDHYQCPEPERRGYECVDLLRLREEVVCEQAGLCKVDCKYNMREIARAIMKGGRNGNTSEGA